MERKLASELDERYVLITDSIEIDSIFEYLGLDVAEYDPGSLLVLAENGDYDEVWYSERVLLYTSDPVYRVA